MLNKTYKTWNLKDYSLTLFFDGKPEFIHFVGGIRVDSTAVFSTSDPKIQAALESMAAFGRDFYICAESSAPESDGQQAPEDIPVEKELPREFIDARKFKNLVEMKDALRKAGLDVNDKWNYAQTKKFAFENGYDYQVSKAES